MSTSSLTLILFHISLLFLSHSLTRWWNDFNKSMMIQYFIPLPFPLCNICLFYCVSSVLFSFHSFSLIYPQKSNLFFSHSLSFSCSSCFFACLCFQQCMSLIAKIFLLFISISFFMLSWIRIEVTTRKRVCVCVYVCVGEEDLFDSRKNKSKKRRSKNDIYLPFSSGKI